MKNDDFWDFVAFWEFFNPFKDKKGEEMKSTSKTIEKVYDINFLIHDLGNEDTKVADSAQENLEKLGEAAIPSLLQALGNESLSIRGRAGWSLVNIGKAVVNPVIEALNNENPEVRFYATFVLQMLRDERSIEPLIKILKEDKNEKVKTGASLALFAIKDPRVKEPLKQYAKEKGGSFGGFVFEDEPYIRKESFAYKEKFGNLKKEFNEKIMPIIKQNPGITVVELEKRGFDSTTIYWLRRIGFIKSEKAENTFKLYLPDDLSLVEKRRYLLKTWEERIEIKTNRYPYSKQAILNYFGKENLRTLFNNSFYSKAWEQEKECDRQSRAEGCKIIRKKDGSVTNMKGYGCLIPGEELEKHLSDEETEFLFSKEDDTRCVYSFLDNIANCLVFDMNQNLKDVFDKYWIKECDEEIKKCYNKYGFFFCSVDRLDSMLPKVIGEEKLKDFYSELEEKANTFEITGSGELCNKTVRSYYIPWFYAAHLKFEWGLKPEIYHKNCMQCGQSFDPFYFMDPIYFPYQKDEAYRTFKVTEFIINYYPIENSINEVALCPKDLPIYFSRKIYDEFFSTTDIAVKDSIKNKLGMLLKSLVDTLGFIPERNFRESFSYLKDLNKQKFEDAIKVLNEMPSYNFGYKEIFGSWLQALLAAGILEGGIRKTSRGYICLAKDGHECRSIGEKIVDDYLFTHNINHEQEPHYPGERLFRADWKVGEYFIEFWGLKGDEDYDKKIEDKKAIAQQHQIPLIEITFDDLRNLEKKFKDIIG